MTVSRIDSHQHFWRLSRGDYAWMNPRLKQIQRDFLPEHLRLILVSHNVEKTVLVQATATLAETEFMLSLADETEWVAGVVGWVDMESTEAIKTLERLRGHPKFKGIRPMIQDIPDPDWILLPGPGKVFDWLEKNQLTFDALVNPVHLKNLEKLLRRHEGLRAVINHGGKPDIAHENFKSWAEDMQSLAANTRALCKLSGLLTEAAPGAGYEELSPYIDHLLRCFTHTRLMWGSDWPVLNLAANYSGWVTICEHALAGHSALEQRAVWRDNAAAFYRLGRMRA
ncbi:MAG TPA: amidohydrolase family protein [Gammaproteobacteria bacterium]|nr:amidohydrolase family protein [Gammaproteobacteria bacterium]